MTKSCVVFGCHNWHGKKGCEGLSFYRLPLKNEELLRTWLRMMRTESVKVNTNSRVCSSHFEGGKKCGPNDVPTIFPWNIKPKRKDPVRRIPIFDSSLPSSVVREVDGAVSVQRPTDTSPDDGGEPTSGNNLPGQSVSSQCPCDLQRSVDSSAPDAAFQESDSVESCEQLSLLEEKEAEYRKMNHMVLELKASLARSDDEKRRLTEELRRAKEDVENTRKELEVLESKVQMLEERKNENMKFSLDSLQDDALVKFYTGLPSCEHLTGLLDFLSDCFPSMRMWSAPQAGKCFFLFFGFVQ